MKKLRILLIFSNLVVKIKTTKITAMHNLFANIVKILEVCKYLANDLVNDKAEIYHVLVLSQGSAILK